MRDFKSQYLYIVLICRVLFFLTLIASALAFISIGIPSIWTNHPAPKAILLISLGLGMFLYLLLNIITSLFAHRYMVVIESGKMFLKDCFSKRTILLTDDNVRGYSLSKYGQGLSFKTLLLYLSNGEIIEFPQFFYTNFKDIPKALEIYGFYYFGFEKYKWRNLLFRDYLFK